MKFYLIDEKSTYEVLPALEKAVTHQVQQNISVGIEGRISLE
jgi:hypothetical protein